MACLHTHGSAREQRSRLRTGPSGLKNYDQPESLGEESWSTWTNLGRIMETEKRPGQNFKSEFEFTALHNHLVSIEVAGVNVKGCDLTYWKHWSGFTRLTHLQPVDACSLGVVCNEVLCFRNQRTPCDIFQRLTPILTSFTATPHVFETRISPGKAPTLAESFLFRSIAVGLHAHQVRSSAGTMVWRLAGWKKNSTRLAARFPKTSSLTST